MINSGGFVGNFLDLLNPDKSLLFKLEKVFKNVDEAINYLKK